jgi:hypothetical protein
MLVTGKHLEHQLVGPRQVALPRRISSSIARTWAAMLAFERRTYSALSSSRSRSAAARLIPAGT